LHISNGRYGLTSSCGGADVDHSASIRRAVEKERAMIVRAKAALTAAKARGEWTPCAFVQPHNLTGP
jgi:hypothetical protein